jgi:hypothetical protein
MGEERRAMLAARVKFLHAQAIRDSFKVINLRIDLTASGGFCYFLVREVCRNDDEMQSGTMRSARRFKVSRSKFKVIQRWRDELHEFPTVYAPFAGHRFLGKSVQSADTLSPYLSPIRMGERGANSAENPKPDTPWERERDRAIKVNQG